MQQTIKGLFLNDCHRIAAWDLYQTFENFWIGGCCWFKHVHQPRPFPRWRIAAILEVLPSLNPDPTGTPTVKMKMEFEDKWQLCTNYKQLSIVSGCNLNGKALGPCGVPRGREGAALGLKFLNNPFTKECGRETDRQTDRKTDRQTWMASDLDSQL